MGSTVSRVVAGIVTGGLSEAARAVVQTATPKVSPMGQAVAQAEPASPSQEQKQGLAGLEEERIRKAELMRTILTRARQRQALTPTLTPALGGGADVLGRSGKLLKGL